MKPRKWSVLAGLVLVFGSVVSRGADSKGPATKPAEPQKAQAVIGGHTLTLATPGGWKGQSKGNGSSWAGAWLSPTGTTLILTATAHAEMKPIAVEKRIDVVLPQLTAKPCPWLKPTRGEADAAFNGFPVGYRVLAGEKDGEKQAGVAEVVDVGPATLTVLSFGPQAPFTDDWKAASTLLQQLALDGSKGPFDYTAPNTARPPATRPAVAAPPVAAAGGVTVGPLTFTPPAKWEVHKDDKHTVLIPPGSKLDNPAATITLLPPASAGGHKLADWLDTFTTTAHQNYAVRQKKDAKEAGGPGGSSVLTQVFVLAPKSAPKRVEYRVYAAIGEGDAVQVILYASPDAETFKAHFPELQHLIEDAKPTAAAKP